MRIKKAAKNAKVAMPKFELNGFFKVTFKREDSQAVASDSQSAANRSPIGRYSRLNASDKRAIAKRLKQAIVKLIF